MNAKQMKQNIRAFRAADVSIIKDATLRAQAQTLQAKQKGFTLLELLIVITLIAVLATAALTAYNGIGESASDTAAANNLLDAQSTLNNYRAIEAGFPDQWDNLANAAGVDTSGGMKTLRATETNAFFGQWVATDADQSTSVWKAVADSMGSVGIEELQSIQNSTLFSLGYVPNLALNESYPLTTTDQGSELALWDADASGGASSTFDEVGVTTAAISIVPSGADSTDGSACTAGGISIAAHFDGTFANENQPLNLINDALDDDDCVLVLAVGFGKDVPGSTSGDKVEVSQVPTLGTNKVNPSTHYARAIALFHVGTDENDDANITVDEILGKARLIGVVDPEGRTRDEVLAAANANGN